MPHVFFLRTPLVTALGRKPPVTTGGSRPCAIIIPVFARHRWIFGQFLLRLEHWQN